MRGAFISNTTTSFFSVSLFFKQAVRAPASDFAALPGRSVTAGRSRSFHTAGDRPRRRNSRRMLADASNPPARPPRHESRPAGVAALISLCHLATCDVGVGASKAVALHAASPRWAPSESSRIVHARWLARSSMVSVSDGGGGGSNRCCTAQRWRHPACLTLLKWRRERVRRPREDEAHDSEPPRARRTDERRI